MSEIKLFFIGSLADHKPGTNQEPTEEAKKMFEAAQQLGYEVASRGYTIMVGSDSKNTIDYYIVQGVISFCDHNPNKIVKLEIHRPKDGKRPYQNVHPNVQIKYKHYDLSEDNHYTWIVTHVRMLDNCDAVIALGGGESTRLIGNLVVDRGRTPIIAIPTFGGAAKDIYIRLEYHYKSIIGNDELVEKFATDWGSSHASAYITISELLIDLSKKLAPPKVFFISYSSKDITSADHVELHLMRKGQRVLRDESGLRTSDQLRDAIESLISQSDVFILLWSENYRQSNWCHYELDFAKQMARQKGHAFKIILITLDQTEVPIEFRERLYHKGNTRKERALALDQVTAELR
jgi:hypothetical protein